MATPAEVTMDTIVSLSKRRGFIFPSSEIYGGFGGFWDYGPLGTELKRNIKEAWWRANIRERDDMVGIDAALIMHPQVWVASGHVQGFTDPLVECKSCHLRFRADELLSAQELDGTGLDSDGGRPDAAATGTANQAAATRCPKCDGELTEPRRFNLMFRTFVGPVEDEAAVAYLRPETAQGIFVNFKNVQNTTRRKLPFGIGQVGKSFRNEITPGKFTFRSREFEQMEIEYFVKPGSDEEWHRRWIEDRFNWYVRFGMRPERLRLRPHASDELAHYAKGCSDVEYRFPFGWSELEGIANRGDFDLRQHAQHSGENLAYFDEESAEHYLPYVIEPSAGVDRSVLAFLIDAYDEEPDKEGTRVVLRFHKEIAPIKVAVLPLSRKEPLVALAREVWGQVRPHFTSQYDDTQAIGRRYRRQDEIGTPFCVTIDFQSLEDRAVTIRERDSMAQVRLPILELVPALQERMRA